ncbi:hypothetical protein EYF80_025336 [Liparis tanakae]|uniref:Uncharacterized protein n=1 Tax=Liparis tanakae TaxID=230148 RepID=A0A4Z2HGV4_9TELE|nr:hypothetical protein EYF80_025336 [Liparis tanakae]
MSRLLLTAASKGLHWEISVFLKSDLSVVSESCYKRRMAESKADAESEAKAPDNDLVWTPDTSEFKATANRLEQLMKGMEVLLLDVEELRGHCSHQATELMRTAVALRQQQEELKEGYSDLSRDMQEITDSLEELFSTKSAFEAKEKQTQKLNRQF